MKKIITYFLLFIFLFNVIFYQSVFYLNQLIIQNQSKNEIELGFKKENFSIINFTETEFEKIHWLKKGKEFLYNNQMFDVISIKNNKDLKIVYCFNDKKEKEFVTKFLKSNERRKETDKKFKRFLINIFELTFFKIIKNNCISNCDNFSYNFFETSKYSKIPSPPPENC